MPLKPRVQKTCKHFDLCLLQSEEEEGLRGGEKKMSNERFYLRLTVGMARHEFILFEIHQDGRFLYENERGKDLIRRKLVVGAEVLDTLKSLVRDSGILKEGTRHHQGGHDDRSSAGGGRVSTVTIDVDLGSERASISYPEKTYHNKDVQSLEHTLRR